MTSFCALSARSLTQVNRQPPGRKSCKVFGKTQIIFLEADDTTKKNTADYSGSTYN